MTRCTTWHVRVDVVEADGQVNARARLIGAPAAMLRPDLSKDEDGLQTLNDLLATWRPLEDMGPVLALTLSAEHATHSEPLRVPGQRESATTV